MIVMILKCAEDDDDEDDDDEDEDVVDPYADEDDGNTIRRGMCLTYQGAYVMNVLLYIHRR